MQTADQTHVHELLSLRGKIALITGASGYLGSALASALAEAGASVVVASRQLARAQEATRRLPRVGGVEHHAVEMDQMEEQSIDDGFAAALAAAHRLDVLVNNGHEALAADWRSVTGEQFSRHMRNATGYFLLARAMRDHLVQRRASGSIVMLGSMYGLVGSYPDTYEAVTSASPVAYHMLKGGIAQLTRHLAVYWARDGVRINTLSPGPFPSEQVPREMVRRLANKSPMARMGRPEELKGAVVFLASEASSYMTGQNLVIDGGWTAW